MKLLQWHCDYFRYKATKPALKAHLDEPSEGNFKNVVVLLVCVEKHDTLETARDAIAAILPNFEQVKAERLLIYPYAHLSRDLAEPTVALAVLKEMTDYAKEKGIEAYRAPFGWYKEFETKVKGHPLAELSKSF